MDGNLRVTSLNISGRLSALSTITGHLSMPEALSGMITIPEVVGVSPYTGNYTLTPSAETQTLDTEGKRMTSNIVINPIPSNYGLITWNGSTLTVS